MKFIDHPRVYLVARPQILEAEVGRMLEHLKAPNLNFGHHSEAILELSGRLCYRSFDTIQNKNLTGIRKDTKDYILNLLRSRHGSVLEHSSFSFAICDVSRVLTHELIRHRAGCSYSQESGRYVRLDQLSFVRPSSDIMGDEELTESLFKALNQIEAFYKLAEQKLFVDDIGFADKKRITSELRRWLPQALTTNLIMTCNLRALRHIIELRTSKHAEAEIRKLFYRIFELVRAEAPNVFQDAVVSETGGSVPTVEFSHGKV